VRAPHSGRTKKGTPCLNEIQEKQFIIIIGFTFWMEMMQGFGIMLS